MSTIILESINIEPLIMAYKRLLEYTQCENSMAETASIKAFEYTYELSWKTLKKVLKKNGIEEITPRSIFRASADAKYIKSPEPWFTFIKLRNESSHTYNDEMFDKLKPHLADFKDEVKTLIETLKTLK